MARVGSTRRRRIASAVKSPMIVLAYLGIGTAVVTRLEQKACKDDASGECPLTFVDGLYWSIVTISTVGYGDVTPSGPGMRAFTILYILFGATYIFVMLSKTFAYVLELWRDRALTHIQRYDRRTNNALDTDGDGEADAQVAGQARGSSGRGLDLDGDGQVDFLEPPSALIFWVQELVPAVLLWLLFQLASAGIFVACQDDLDYGLALYHCFITATTVGYGDVSLHTTAARGWACFHILVSVSWLAALVGQVEACSSFRSAQLKRAAILTCPLDRDKVLALDADKNGVDKLEFVIGMLKILGVELCGVGLEWDDVKPFIKRFEELDKSGDGKIGKDDLEQFIKDNAEEHRRRQEKLKPSTLMRIQSQAVLDRDARDYVAKRMVEVCPPASEKVAREWKLAKVASSKGVSISDVRSDGGAPTKAEVQVDVVKKFGMVRQLTTTLNKGRSQRVMPIMPADDS